MGQQLVAGALLHDPAALKHDHPLAEATGHAQVVGHKEQGKAKAALEIAQQRQHLRLHFGIEHADALIAEQHLGLQHQGPGDGHALLLAARELAG